MIVLGAAALVTALVGAVVALVGIRWPRADPSAPDGHLVTAKLAEHPGVAHEVGEKGGAERVTVVGLSIAALGVVASATLFGILVLLVRTHAGFAQLDVAPARWAARHASPTSSSVLRTLTHLGSSAFVISLLVVVGLVEFRRLPNRAIPLFLFLVEAGQLLLHSLIKLLVGRARPGYDQLVGASGLSFPSGHATNAAATFAALALLLGRRRSPTTRVALVAVAAALTALVASTRVLLGVHWVTDVLAGAALGWGWAALCSVAFGGRLLRFGDPVGAAGAATPAASVPPSGEDGAPTAEPVGSG